MLVKFLKTMSVAMIVTGLWLSTASSMVNDKPGEEGPQPVSKVAQLEDLPHDPFGVIIEYLDLEDRRRIEACEQKH
jgi:hypothetical protein